MHTLEESIKFDHGLSIGVHPVLMERRDGSQYGALVEIRPSGAVYLLPKPREDQMYTSWWRIKESSIAVQGNTIVWGARDPEMLKRFDNPVAVIRMPRHGVVQK